MKRIIRFVLLAITLCASLSASAYEEGTYLIAGGNLCTPLTIKCDNGDTYKVYDQVYIPKLVSIRSAVDCNGNNIVIPGGDYKTRSGEYHYRYYTFKTLYRSSNSSSSNSGGYHNGSSSSGWSDTGRRAGEALADGMISHAMYESGKAYPGLHALMGVSKGFGENIRLKIVAGGFSVWAGVGKDWFFNGDNKDKFLWHVGMGGYISTGDREDPNGDVTIGLNFAENAAWEDYSLTFDLSYTYWIGRWKRFGVFGGAGIGWGHIKHIGEDNYHSKTAWNLEAGIAIRLAHF